MIRYYVRWNGVAWIVKEGDFFESQGWLTEEWVANWLVIYADSIEHARDKSRIQWGTKGELVTPPSSPIDKLRLLAPLLNEERSKLGVQVAGVNEALKKLGLGVFAWYALAVTKTHERALGYAKVNGHWGLALRHRPLDDKLPVKTWLFNDAPMYMRLESVGHFDSLLDTMVSAVERTIKQTTAAADVVEEFKEGLCDGNNNE